METRGKEGDAGAMQLRGGLLLLVLASCYQESSQPPPQQQPPPPQWGAQPPPQQGPRCADGPAMCSNDRQAIVQCRGGVLNLVQSCLGPQGCALVGGALQCDTSIARPGEPCAPEGGYACSQDRRALLACRGARSVVASTCRGQNGCAVTTGVACDHSIAAPGDPCDGPNELACSMDRTSMMRCRAGVYAPAEACRGSCLNASGRVLCQQ